MLRLIGIACLCALSALILREQNGKIVPLVSLSGLLFLLLYLVRRFGGAVAVFCDLAERSAMSPYLGTLLKVLACGYLSEIGADVLRELGAASAASVIETIGRVEILVLCLPAFVSLTELALSLSGG